MRKHLKACALAACLIGMSGYPAFGADYSAMSTEELAAQRGSMRDAPAEEREAFQKEWQNRLQSMSQEERRQMMGRPENAPQEGLGNQNRNNNRHGQGWSTEERTPGAGGMRGGGRGQGGGMGRGRR